MTAQNGYANIHGWELYDTTGTTEDWSYNATGGFGYTFEIGPNEFHPPFPRWSTSTSAPGSTPARATARPTSSRSRTPSTPPTHSVLTGKAPPGATLRLRKQFATPTWDGLVHRHPGHHDERRAERPVHLARQPVHPPGRAGPAGRDHRGRPVARADLRTGDHGAAAARRPRVHGRPRPASTCSRSTSTGRPRTTSTSRSTARTPTARSPRSATLGQLRRREGARRARAPAPGNYVLRVINFASVDADATR